MTRRDALLSGGQGGQMLVSVIVLLTLMFFIGSAMALAVSSSLHTIAQVNSTDSVAYAAESAIGQGLARAHASRPEKAEPIINHVPADNNGNKARSYSYEVLNAAGATLGRSAVGTDSRGVDSLDATNYETITIADVAGADKFQIYRTAASGTPSTVGYITTVTAVSGGDTVVQDTGIAVSSAPPIDCSGATLPPLSNGKVNGQTLSAGTCYAALNAGTIETWAVPAQKMPAGTCVANVAMPARAPGNPGVVWGVIGWHSISTNSKKKPNLEVFINSGCSPGGQKCDTPVLATDVGVLYFQCPLSTTKVESPGKLKVVNAGSGDGTVSSFVVREADSGPDCVATTVGLAARVGDEADWRLSVCGWTSPAQSLWNRVLP